LKHPVGSDQAFGEAREGQKSNNELVSSGIKTFLDYNSKTRSFRGLRLVMWLLNLVK